MVSEEKMFENVDGRTDGRGTDGRRSDWYTISSPMSLGSGELKRALTQSKLIQTWPVFYNALHPTVNWMKLVHSPFKLSIGNQKCATPFHQRRHNPYQS